MTTASLEKRLAGATAAVREHWRGRALLDGLEPGPKGVEALLELARVYRGARMEVARLAPLRGRAVAALFFDPSLRTRASMEVASARLGAHFLDLRPGDGSWALAFADRARMDGAEPEHVREAAPVLSAYVDALAIRSFPKGEPDDRDEVVLRSFARFATVPVLNLESALAHPCQGLADQLTLDDLAGGRAAGKKVCLTWAPHPKPLPQAVPLSFLRAAALAGAEIHVAHPEGFELDAPSVAAARAVAAQTGATISFTRDPDAAADGALAVYAKGWGAVDRAAHADRVRALGAWTVGASRMRSAGAFLHCLPVRRNVIVTDEVLDGAKSRVVAQAANREPVQAAVLLAWLL